MPSCFKTLESIILNGVDSQYQDSTDSQVNHIISQTLLFNFSKHTPATVKCRLLLERQPPLPLYYWDKNSQKLYRSKKIVNHLYDLV